MPPNLSEMSAQMALLAGGRKSFGADSEGPTSSTIPVICNGVTGLLAITADSGVQFGLSEVRRGPSAL